MSDCGPPCEALNDREHAVHLLHLRGVPAWKCYLDTAKEGQSPTRPSCERAGSRMLKSVQIQKAIAWHQEIDALKVSISRNWMLGNLKTIGNAGAQDDDVKAPAAVAAMALIAKMQGYMAPKKIDLRTISELGEAAAGGDEDAERKLQEILAAGES